MVEIVVGSRMCGKWSMSVTLVEINDIYMMGDI
jgi:hypothetical protein